MSNYVTSLLQTFDPKFIPAVEIDGTFSLKHSVTHESIIASLKHTTNTKGERVFCTDKDVGRETIPSSCNVSNNNIIAHCQTLIRSSEANDSGTVLMSSGQDSSNCRGINTSPINAHAGGLVDHQYSCSSSSSSSDLSEKAAQCTNDNMSSSQEYKEEAPVPHISLSGANAVSGSLNSAGQTSAGSGYVLNPGHCEALVHPYGSNAAINSQTESWSLFDSGHIAEPQDQTTTVTASFGTLEEQLSDEYVQEHVAQNRIVISSGSSSNSCASPVPDKMVTGMGGSSLSLMCDTEY